MGCVSALSVYFSWWFGLAFVLFPLLVYNRKQDHFSVLTTAFISIVEVFAVYYWCEIEIHSESKLTKTLLEHTFNDSFPLQAHIVLVKVAALGQIGWFWLCYILNLKKTSSKNDVLQGTFQMLCNNLFGFPLAEKQTNNLEAVS